MTLQDRDKMDEDNEDLFDKKDLRAKKDKKRIHKQSKEKEECARESFKKMKEEIDELRKREADRAKELDELRKKIEEQTSQKQRMNAEPEYTIGFNRETYLKKGFIESAKWIRDVIAKNMHEKMMNDCNKSKFELLLLAKKKSVYLGARACARFNRGEDCHQGRWHITQKHESLRDRLGTRSSGEPEDDSRYPTQDHQSRKSELRLHACTLCIEALGAAFGHSVLDCPWILKKNWIE